MYAINYFKKINNSLDFLIFNLDFKIDTATEDSIEQSSYVKIIYLSTKNRQRNEKLS